MKRKLANTLAAVFAVIHLSAFSLPDIPGLTNFIPAITGALGGAACYAFFKGENQALATALCTAGTTLIGVQLRNYLKDREQTQAQLMKATYETLETGKAQTVKTEEGDTITTELVRPSSAAPAMDPKIAARHKKNTTPSAASGQETVAAAEGECGTVKQTIVTKDDQRLEGMVNACKKEGTWVG